QAQHNLDRSIDSFARACFRYALSERLPLWFAAKDTISKTYDHRFKDAFDDIYAAEFREPFEAAGITYSYMLIDAALAGLVRSEGGFLMACKNYDGDILSDLISQAFGSIAMMTSVLVSPDGCFEYEAAHGTVTQHYYQYRRGQEPSTNPVATICAWTGALRRRGQMDDLADLSAFADDMERAALQTISAGVITEDLAALYSGPFQVVPVSAFLAAVRTAYEKRR
ncbi:MAG: NADP-dependent isocitrate dehydrogenase, partial [Oscillospiraceae bacterium]|nr:NADP-dependent isocitrate dehydrogenase [Oscillospiraceae bacterium]